MHYVDLKCCDNIRFRFLFRLDFYLDFGGLRKKEGVRYGEWKGTELHLNLCHKE